VSSPIRRIVARLRGDDLAVLRREIAEQRQLLLDMNHTIQETQRVIQALNHDVRAGSVEVLPLFQGYVDRLRLDSETAIAASQVIERQLARIEVRPEARPEGDVSS
jgi:hypothetical protein